MIRRSRRGPALVALGVVLVGLLAWAVGDRVAAKQAPSAHTMAVDAALAAARTAAPALVGYDYRTVSGLADRVAPLLTRSCAAQFRGAAATLGPQVEAARATSTAEVRAAGVRTAGSTRVEVLAFVAVSSSDRTRPQPLTSLVPLGLVLERHGGRWLVDAEVTDPGSGGKQTVGCDIAAR